MDSAILSAIVSGIVTLIVCLITNHSQNEKTRALLEYRMNVLEQKMDRHLDLENRVLRVELKLEELANNVTAQSHQN